VYRPINPLGSAALPTVEYANVTHREVVSLASGGDMSKVL